MITIQETGITDAFSIGQRSNHKILLLILLSDLLKDLEKAPGRFGACMRDYFGLTDSDIFTDPGS